MSRARPQLFFEEPQGSESICMVIAADRQENRCKDRNCGKPTATLLDGYCIDCAARHNVNPMRSVCNPIRLTAEACS